MPFRIIIAVIAEIGAIVGTIAYPYFGLLALLFMTFGRPQEDRPNIIALHIPLVLVLSIAAGTLGRLGTLMPIFLVGLKRLRMILIFFALMTISAVVSYTPLAAARLDEFTTVICLCLLTLGWVTMEERLRGYILVLLASGAFTIARAIRDPSTIVEQIGDQTFTRLTIGKETTLFGQTNYLALFTVMVIFLSITLMAYYRAWWQRGLLLALSAGGAYVFFRAQSRGASLALAAGMIFLWLIQGRKVRNAVLALVLVGAGALLAPQQYWDRLATIRNYQEDTSATSRLELWDTARQLIEKHPFLGVGPDNFVLYAPNSPHNAYLQVGSELGIPAMLVYIGILLAGLRAAWRARRISMRDEQGSAYLYAVSQGILCCQLAIVIQGFTTGLAHREFVYVFVTLGFLAESLAEQAHAENSQMITAEQETLEHI